ncbi:uncharacterized protein LOC120155001 [Hibiscus syriacus]|uniref:uncharacterized protein LOC120155001 n=1 Tax=Hibiscus syriacus TaxID=106335 RepID=UPI00192320DE|nr:uncharacterized protein LOC120155001 [Hibiscus syriacus]
MEALGIRGKRKRKPQRRGWRPLCQISRTMMMVMMIMTSLIIVVLEGQRALPLLCEWPSIGLAGGRPMQGRSPMAKNIPQRRPSPLRKQQPYDDDNDEDAPVSNTTSIGLTATAKRSPSPARKSLARTRIPPAAADDEIDEDDLLVSSTTRIGLGGRAARPFSPMVTL